MPWVGCPAQQRGKPTGVWPGRWGRRGGGHGTAPAGATCSPRRPHASAPPSLFMISLESPSRLLLRPSTFRQQAPLGRIPAYRDCGCRLPPTNPAVPVQLHTRRRVWHDGIATLFLVSSQCMVVSSGPAWPHRPGPHAEGPCPSPSHPVCILRPPEHLAPCAAADARVRLPLTAVLRRYLFVSVGCGRRYRMRPTPTSVVARTRYTQCARVPCPPRPVSWFFVDRRQSSFVL